jgi:hypothetical protein
VIKLSGSEKKSHTGPARVFDREEDAFRAVQARKIKAGDVVIIRYEGPKGGPGMREMLQVTGASVGQGISKDVALITDGRFSGATYGFMAGHGERRADRVREGRRHRDDRCREAPDRRQGGFEKEDEGLEAAQA